MKLTKRQQQQIYFERKTALIKEVSPHLNTFSDIMPALFDLQKQERRLQRLAELSCNGYPMPKTEYRDGKTYCYDVEDVKLRARCEKREASIEKYVVGVAKYLGLSVDFQGDPRGMMFSLKTPQGVSIDL